MFVGARQLPSERTLPRSSPEPAKMFVCLDFEGHTELFGPPPSRRYPDGRPWVRCQPRRLHIRCPRKVSGKRGEEAAVGGWQLIEITKEDGVDAAKRAHSASFIFGPFTTLWCCRLQLLLLDERQQGGADHADFVNDEPSHWRLHAVHSCKQCPRGNARTWPERMRLFKEGANIA